MSLYTRRATASWLATLTSFGFMPCVLLRLTVSLMLSATCWSTSTNRHVCRASASLFRRPCTVLIMRSAMTALPSPPVLYCLMPRAVQSVFIAPASSVPLSCHRNWGATPASSNTFWNAAAVVVACLCKPLFVKEETWAGEL